MQLTEQKSSTSRAAGDWQFIKHKLNPESAPLVKERAAKNLQQVAGQLDLAAEKLLQPYRLPFVVGIVYFLLILWQFSGFGLASGFSASSLGKLDLWKDVGDDRALQQLATASEQAWSIMNYQDVDLDEFSSVSVTEYEVGPGDTLSDIALRFGLRMDTLVSYNNIPDVRRMQIGQILKVPNRDGLKYNVKAGDSLNGIAQAHGSGVNALLDANNLSSTTLMVGQELFIPNARMDQIDLALALGDLFVYPVQGRLTSTFGYRDDPFTGLRRFHNGIDIANAVGTAVRASMSGRVVRVESQVGNYGKYIIIEHPRGYSSLYAHLDSFAVRVGEYVSQGQLIGRLGSTGRSTGPHTHFSIIERGNFVDPLRFLH